MSQLQWEEEKEERKAEYLARHKRMAGLFVNDRLAFERERKRLFDEFFEGIEDEGMRVRLQALQNSYEEKMRHAGSAHNRFVLAQTFFWDHFHKIWQPGIQRMSARLKGFTSETAPQDPV